jgi:hypothetical protein
VLIILQIWAKLTYSNISPVCPVPRLKISHVSTLTSSTNGVSWKKKKKKTSQLSLTSAFLSYQATMAELVQAMRDGEKETITINTPKTQTPYTARDPNPKPKNG